MRKQCSKCKEVKDLSEFHKNLANKDKLSNSCKSCSKIYYELNKERIKKQHQKWAEANKEKIKEYHKNRYIENRDAIILQHKLYIEKNRDNLDFKRSRLKTRLRYKYNLSLSEYENLLNQQNHSCAICGEKVKLVVDHNHTTNEVRGLLCNLCNRAIGGFKENINNLKNAITYLKENNYECRYI